MPAPFGFDEDAYTTPTWDELVGLEPRLADVAAAAQQYVTYGDGAYYGFDRCPVNLKRWLEDLVGWFRTDSSPSFPDEADDDDLGASMPVDLDPSGTSHRHGSFKEVARRNSVARMSRELTQAAEAADGRGVLWTAAAWNVASHHIRDLLGICSRHPAAGQ